METQQTTKPEIRTYDYGIFSIDVCQNCFSYKFNHDPDLVFHRINAEHLDAHKSPIITPKGVSDAPYYYHYLGKRSIHLGPLFVQPLTIDVPDAIWFGFDINKIKEKYPNLRFLNDETWFNLVLYANVHPIEERKEMERKLFISDYNVGDITTVILPDELDCSLADFVITRTKEDANKAEKFAKKNLESVIFGFESAQKLEGDYISHLHHTDEEWHRFLHEHEYKFPECKCEIN